MGFRHHKGEDCMKLEQLALELKVPKHQVSNGTGLSVISGGQHYIYLCDPISGEVERRAMGEVEKHCEYMGSFHGMGAVRD